ncbi:uncharacterized protein B0H18DRAFT_1117688 [Fomitopsis serialis]|uniref:uncharacterized protein n=1 Tax=Fomitopsis serialis TaxID=139415 RepID=UPI0020089685|nr:uncharacterized protein B0H18DRAFT_1117688 [Neoantrodia serialis]KAH9928865.1 hypothetical protein B0H18DRAFT_1117688 [Neoantrodia serialis]
MEVRWHPSYDAAARPNRIACSAPLSGACRDALRRSVVVTACTSLHRRRSASSPRRCLAQGAAAHARGILDGPLALRKDGLRPIRAQPEPSHSTVAAERRSPAVSMHPSVSVATDEAGFHARRSATLASADVAQNATGSKCCHRAAEHPRGRAIRASAEDAGGVDALDGPCVRAAERRAAFPAISTPLALAGAGVFTEVS